MGKPRILNKVQLFIGAQGWEVGTPGPLDPKESPIAIGDAVQSLLLGKQNLVLKYVMIEVDEKRFDLGVNQLITEELASEIAQKITRYLGELTTGKKNIL